MAASIRRCSLDLRPLISLNSIPPPTGCGIEAITPLERGASAMWRSKSEKPGLRLRFALQLTAPNGFTNSDLGLTIFQIGDALKHRYFFLVEYYENAFVCQASFPERDDAAINSSHRPPYWEPYWKT